MFGRKVALTFVKANKDKNNTAEEQMPLEDAVELIQDAIIDTAGMLGLIAVGVAASFATIRIVEHMVKNK